MGNSERGASSMTDIHDDLDSFIFRMERLWEARA
jgi:hypothetical protein